MSNFIVKKVAVLGAGVMGAQIAAHCINARVPVVLFDLPAKEGPKNGIVLRAIENLKKLSPAPLGNKDHASLIEVANYDDNQHAADENLRVKNLWDGIETYAALLAGMGAAWGARATP